MLLIGFTNQPANPASEAKRREVQFAMWGCSSQQFRLLFVIVPAVNRHPVQASPIAGTLQSLTPASKIPWNFIESPFFLEIYEEAQIAFQFTCRLRRPFKRRTCCFKPRFRFLIRGSPPDKGGKGEAEEEAAAIEKILIERSPPDNEFSPTIQMYLQNAWVIHYSRSWSVTMDLRNEWCYLFADFISLILLIPLACVPLLIRK